MAEPLPGRLVFDEAAFRTIADSLGCEDDRQRATLLGVHETTYGRLKTGEIQPGEIVLRNFFGRFPNIDPRRVFRYDAEAKRRERAA